jgi:amino-acid N-acetyltransferase
MQKNKMRRKRKFIRKPLAADPVVIRKATSNDFGAIRTLIRKYPEKLLQTHLPKPKFFFVAVHEKHIVACCALEVYSKRLAEVRSLVVDTKFQGHGIATALIERCLAEARKKKVYEVLTVTGATKLFEKNGFNTFNNEKYALLKVLG